MKRDLFVVVADLDAEHAIKTLLCSRQKALEIEIDFDPATDLLRYIGRDPGCCKNAVDLLRAPQSSHKHAILFFDKDGCGEEEKKREEIEAGIEKQLQKNGWLVDSVAVIIFDPELEAWVWSSSPQVAKIMGWGKNFGSLRNYIKKKGFLPPKKSKPSDPKGAMRAALQAAGQRYTATVFAELAKKVSVKGCNDPSFNKFVTFLQKWFPQSP
jgi:hypothetical protein